MKILVISDSHGRRDLVERCIRCNSQAEIVLHLGDHYSDIDNMRFTFPDRMFLGVKGNGDFDHDALLEQTITVEGVKILLAHGHTFGVNYSLSTIMAEARNQNAQICLYGHTHVPYNKYHDGLYVMNPGSLAYPRGGSAPSFGIIEICPQGILTNIVDTMNMFRA